jgi:cytochrome c peroxidase
MKKNILILGTFALLAFGWQSCVRDNGTPTLNEAKLVLPTTEFDYQKGVSDFHAALIAQPNNTTTDNRFRIDPNSFFADIKGINNSKATLGRVLFYDAKMSVNNTVACGSCHLQSKAFSDVADVSSGFQGVKTTRNSMSIANPLLTNNLFWDSRSRSLQDMALKPVQNHVEMGMEDLSFLAKKLNSTTYYPALFKKAFGDEVITSTKINEALTQFLSSMVTHNSKFDEGAKKQFSNFSNIELVGKDLFMSERLSCTKCHTGANFSLGDDKRFDNPYGGGGGGSTSANGTANVGLDMFYKDNGSGNGKFKIPSLRNIELTAPYMHDGRFKTLEQVVEHYNNGIQAHPNLDGNLKNANGEPRKLNLSPIEKTALVAFLKTLSDPTYTSDVKYSDPFKY